MAKDIKDINKEIADLKKENGDLELKVEGLVSDNELLNKEIADLKKAPKKSVENKKELSPKERGYTTVMDIAKRKAEAIKNTPGS